jgi:hypothetical protein
VERARAGAVAGDAAVVVGSAEALLTQPRRATPALTREALALLDARAAPSALRERWDDAARRLRELAQRRGSG